MNNDVILYSALYGRYDRPKQVPHDLGIPALMFVGDQELADIARECGWRPIIEPRVLIPTDMMKHKFWKLHPISAKPEADISIWLDASMTITAPNFVDRCLEALGDDDWSMVRHPVRDCIYDEAYYSATLTWRYDADALIRQAEYYRSIGHPPHWGLIATGANVRRHTSAVKKWCDHWWYENVHRSHQDQISLSVLLRLAGSELKWNTNFPWHEWWHLSEHGW